MHYTWIVLGTDQPLEYFWVQTTLVYFMSEYLLHMNSTQYNSVPGVFLGADNVLTGQSHCDSAVIKGSHLGNYYIDHYMRRTWSIKYFFVITDHEDRARKNWAERERKKTYHGDILLPGLGCLLACCHLVPSQAHLVWLSLSTLRSMWTVGWVKICFFDRHLAFLAQWKLFGFTVVLHFRPSVVVSSNSSPSLEARRIFFKITSWSLI